MEIAADEMKYFVQKQKLEFIISPTSNYPAGRQTWAKRFWGRPNGTRGRPFKLVGLQCVQK